MRMAGWLFAVHAVLILVSVFWAYLPGLSGPAVFDDFSNVGVLPDFQGDLSRAWESVWTNRSGPLGRPVSMATFVAERWVFGESVYIGKLINLLLHLLNGFLVFGFLVAMGRGGRWQRPAWLALALTAAWLAAPLYVSTVLYHVQRMALLSTTFMLCTCLSYLRWRSSLAVGGVQWHWLVLAFVSLVAAVFSKENAVVVVPILLVLELCWLRCRDRQGIEVPALKRGVLICGVTALVVVVAITLYKLPGYLNGYSGRPFTVWERLMTESRVLWDYLRQFVWPDSTRLGVFHDDFSRSNSLLDPPATLLAMFAWLLLGALCILLRSHRVVVLFACGLAFYLLGHSVESTVLPLELYFEHRNYFPMVGLLLSLGVLVDAVWRRMPETFAPGMACLALWFVAQLLVTGSQAQVWSLRPLWVANDLVGHPQSPRANLSMAVQLAALEDFDRARKYSVIAAELMPNEADADNKVRELALACLARASVSPEAISGLADLRALRSSSSEASLSQLVAWLQDGVCPEFPAKVLAQKVRESLRPASSSAPIDELLYLQMAVLENFLGRYKEAAEYTKAVLGANDHHVTALLMQLQFSTVLNESEQADMLVQRLLYLKRNGKLSVAQQQTLSLYTEQ